MPIRLTRGTALVGSLHPSAQEFTDIAVDDTATIDTLDVTNDATVGGTLDVTGVATVASMVGDRFAVTAPLLAASVDTWVFVAPVACELVAVEEIHSVVGGSGAAVRPRRITDVSAPGASASETVIELTAAFDLETTANTVVSGTVVTAGDVHQFAAGDALGLDFAGTLTGLVGHITFWFKTLPEA